MRSFLQASALSFIILFEFGSTSAFAATIPLLISIGNNIGDPAEVPLHYAEADARRVQTVFVEIGGVSSERAYLVVNCSASRVRERLAEVAGRIAELRTAGHDVVLLVYVSAHAKAGELHLNGSHLALAELRNFAGNTQARLRVLFVDACDSGAIARQKGGSAGPEYEVSLERMPLTGQVIISSSGPAEPSQEWGSLKGSLFTYYLLAGLRGDADSDGDGLVTLSEAYAYAYRRTVAQDAGFVQHPAFDLDLAGTGELVLTKPAGAKNALLFPAALEGHYVVASQPRPDVVIEVDKRPGKAVRIAIPPGSYLVRKRIGEVLGLLTVELPYGGEKVLDESGMVHKPYVEVAMKGELFELRPHAFLAFGDVGTAVLSGAGPSWHVGIGYRHSWEEYWGLVSVAFGANRFRGVDLTTSEASISAAVSAGYRWLFSPIIVRLGLSAEAEVFRESYLRDQEQQIQVTFNQGHLPTRYSLGFAVGPIAAIEVPLPWSAFVVAEVEPLIRRLSADHQLPLAAGFQGLIGVGRNF